MVNSYRLNANNLFSRVEENNQESPSRIVFLAVEGNKTECQYFDLIEKYREDLQIKKCVHIHPLKRAKKDNYSSPEKVLELLEEYIELRDTESLPQTLAEVIPKKYSYDFIVKYINHELGECDEVKEFEFLLRETGIDLAYNLFLQDYKGEDDIFGIMIDRDYKSHTVEQMKKVYSYCLEKDYKCYITTPLFEFWLLLHLVNVKEKYAGDLQKILINDKVSEKHTYTSKLVSELAGHAKGINEQIFKEYYLENIDFAINQVRNNFTADAEELIGNDSSEIMRMGKIGSNIPDLFDLLRNA